MEFFSIFDDIYLHDTVPNRRPIIIDFFSSTRSGGRSFDTCPTNREPGITLDNSFQWRTGKTNSIDRDGGFWGIWNLKMEKKRERDGMSWNRRESKSGNRNHRNLLATKAREALKSLEGHRIETHTAKTHTALWFPLLLPSPPATLTPLAVKNDTMSERKKTKKTSRKGRRDRKERRRGSAVIGIECDRDRAATYSSGENARLFFTLFHFYFSLRAN